MILNWSNNIPGRANGTQVVRGKAAKRDIFLPMKTRKRTSFRTDKRRKHHHWQVTLFYKDGETFIRVYSDREKAASFAERQRKSPVVKMARVIEVS
jgi:hypothetical protein